MLIEKLAMPRAVHLDAISTVRRDLHGRRDHHLGTGSNFKITVFDTLTEWCQMFVEI